MNKQQIFDTVAAHLLTQNERAVGDTGLCMYRVSKGGGGVVLRCAIGSLIPDEMYTLNMEGAAVPLLLTMHPKLRAHLGITEAAPGKDDKEHYYDIDNPEVAFLNKLQAIHDGNWSLRNGFDVEDWPWKLREFARLHNLDEAVINVASSAALARVD